MNLSGARGLTLKAGDPLSKVACYKLHLFAHFSQIQRKNEDSSHLLSPKGKILFDITDKALKLDLTSEAPK